MENTQTALRNQDEFRAILQLVPDTTPSGVSLRSAIEERVIKIEMNQTKFKERQQLRNAMEKIRAGLPERVLGVMNTLALATDDEDQETLKENMFNPDNDNSLMEIIADLLFIANHTEITPPKREGGNGSRITRAETLARAHSPEWTNYGFCPKCNRPMMKSYIREHQRSMVCVEIKQGKFKALQLGKVKDKAIGEHIAQSVLYDLNDSSDEEQE